MRTVRNVNGAAPTARRLSWEADYGLPALGALIGLAYLPVLAVLGGLKMLPSAIAGVAYFVTPLVVTLLCHSKLRAAAIQTTRHGFQSRPIELVLIGLGVAGVVACLFAQFTLRQADAGGMWLQFLMAASLAFLTPLYRDLPKSRNMLRPVLRGWSLVGLIAVGTMVLHLTGLVRGEAIYLRQFGILGDPVAWMISIFVVIYFEQKNWLFFAATLVLLAVTGSRAPAIMAALGLMLSAGARPSRTASEAAIRIIGAVGAMLVLLASPVLMPQVFKRIVQTDIASNDRMPTILFSFDRWLESPIFGAGYNAQVFYLDQLGLKHGELGLFNQQPSTWLQMLTDFGIPGFALFALFSLIVLLACIRVVRSVPTGVPAGEPMKFYLVTRALACWLVPFIVLNQSAPYIVPGSLMGLLYFAGAGMVLGLDQQLRARPAAQRRPPASRGAATPAMPWARRSA